MKITEISRKLGFAKDGLSVTRVVDVDPYSAIGDLAFSLIGGVTVQAGRFVRILPARDPLMPQCFVTDVQVEGLGTLRGGEGADNALIVPSMYDRGRLTITYKTPDRETPEEKEAASNPNSTEFQELDLAEQSWDFSAQALTLPTKAMRFQHRLAGFVPSDGSVNAVKVMPKIDFTLSRSLVATVPFAAITALCGKINAAPFRVNNRVWPTECLRYDGASVKQKITSLGFKYFDVSHKFAIQPAYDYVATTDEVAPSGSGNTTVTPSQRAKMFVGWNRVYAPDKGLWDYLVEKDNVYRGIYNYDTEVEQNLAGRLVRGFMLLFHPRAT